MFLNTAKKLLSIIAFISVGAIVWYFYTYNPAQSTGKFIACFSKQISGLDCPGCGGQRAFHELLNGNFIKAAKQNILIYIFAPLLGYVFLTFTLKPFKIILPELNISTKKLVAILLLILVFSIFRNITF